MLLGLIQASGKVEGKVEEKWRKSGGKVEESGGKVAEKWRKMEEKSGGKVKEKWRKRGLFMKISKTFFSRLKGRTNSTRKTKFSSNFYAKNLIKLLNFKKIEFFPPLFPPD